MDVTTNISKEGMIPKVIKYAKDSANVNIYTQEARKIVQWGGYLLCLCRFETILKSKEKAPLL